MLALIGGAFMVAGGALALSMYGLWSQGGGWWLGGGGSGGPMMGGMGGWMMPGFMWWAVGAMAGVSLALGGVVLAGGYVLSKRPWSTSAWGVAILVASVIGLFSMSGFFIGPILGIIAGIMALTAKR